MLLQSAHQGIATGQGFQCTRKQNSTGLYRDARQGLPRFFDGVAKTLFDMSWVFFGDHATIKFKHHFTGDHVGIGAAVDQTDIEVGVINAGHITGNRLVAVI